MTKDLAIACGKKDEFVTTGEYLEAVEKRMRAVLSSKL
jgi:isocitrate dehydrogenase